jgi:Holliday junction resolvase RusA-like endonuclease
VTVSVNVPGEPVPASRPRVTKRGVTYYPKRYTEFLERIARAWQAEGRPVIDGDPVAIGARVEVLIPRPKSHLLTGGQVRAGAPLIPGRADLDNFVKAALDGLVACGAMPDDRRVVELSATKAYAQPGHPGGLIVDWWVATP